MKPTSIRRFYLIIISLLVILTLVNCGDISVSEEELSGISLDLETILSEGIYSDLDRYITYQDMTFKSIDLLNVKDKINSIKEHISFDSISSNQMTIFCSTDAKYLITSAILHPDQSVKFTPQEGKVFDTIIYGKAKFRFNKLNSILRSANAEYEVSSQLYLDQNIIFEALNSNTEDRKINFSIFFIAYNITLDGKSFIIYEPANMYYYSSDII